MRGTEKLGELPGLLRMLGLGADGVHHHVLKRWQGVVLAQQMVGDGNRDSVEFLARALLLDEAPHPRPFNAHGDLVGAEQVVDLGILVGEKARRDRVIDLMHINKQLQCLNPQRRIKFHARQVVREDVHAGPVEKGDKPVGKPPAVTP